MSVPKQTPQAGCYRLAHGVRLVRNQDAEKQGTGEGNVFAITDYPLRSVRLNAASARLLALCATEQHSAQLARMLHLPLARVEALCESLYQKNLLERGPLPPLAEWPAVSIVVPVHNRANGLVRCLHSLLTLDYPSSCLEIIVIDDGSTDQTAATLQFLAQQAAECNITFRVIRHDERQGVALARNTGAAAASHAFLAYIDSDCVASPHWLAELIPAFQDERVSAVGGMIRALDCSSLLGRYEDVRSSLFMGQRVQRLHLAGPLTYLPTANLIVRRSAWQQLAGFAHLTHGEDVDFCHRLLLTGARIVYLPYGVVYHDYRTTWRAFLRIRVAYASSEAVLLQRHAIDRRILLLPPLQATFAGAALGMASYTGTTIFRVISMAFVRNVAARHSNTHKASSIAIFLLALLITLATVIFGTREHHRRVQVQRAPIGVFTILKATLRGHLAYTYHLCRHLTRYYTLPLLLLSLLLPPLFPFIFVLCAIVICVDYGRLHPRMTIGAYAICSILDDCAYDVGVLLGCLKYKIWQPLLPVVKRQ
jgi:mycofactocin system glycosyltransferase